MSKRKRKPKVDCVHAMKVSRGCSYITPLMLIRGTKLGCTVNFIPLSHVTTVKKPWYPLNRRTAEPPEPIWTFWWTEKSTATARNRTLDCPAHSLLTILAMLSWLHSDTSTVRECHDRAHSKTSVQHAMKVKSSGSVHKNRIERFKYIARYILYKEPTWCNFGSIVY
jgi:hypothetical protein